MMTLLSMLPVGWLPRFILLSSGFSVFNTVQCLLMPLGLTRRIYSQQPQQVTQLTSHVFAAWTLLSAVLRYQCAYNMSNGVVYDLTFWSYVIAAAHFVSEIVVFKSIKFPGPVISTFCVAITSIFWMIHERDFYVG